MCYFNMLNRLIRLSFCKVNKFRAQHLIDISESAFSPVFQFESMNLYHKLFQNIKKMSCSVPTPIQSQSFPVLQQGQNLVGISKTGSGKTIGFLLPLLNKILNNKKDVDSFSSPKILVVEPTRELCKQTFLVCKELINSTGLQISYIHGGTGIKIFDNVKGRKIDILVSTPGVLLDGINRNYVDLSNTQYLILDEADFLLEIGFRQDLLKINNYIKNPKTQRLFFSATWDKSVRSVVNQMTNNKFVTLRVGQLDKTVNENISQEVHVTGSQHIYDKLKSMLNQQLKGLKMLIFCNMKSTVNNLHYSIRKNIDCIKQHSEISQDIRLKNHNKFKQGQVKVMIATNVAARGLDVKDIDVVINYMLPNTIQQYTHRIGRTGRAGQKGRSISLCSDKQRLLPQLKNRKNVKFF